jgi:lysozyme
MNISDKGLDLIKEHEGCRLVAYLDARVPPIWTIGYGSTTDVAPGMRITQVQADERLKNDVQDAEKCVNGCVDSDLTQNEYDALCSFVFNVGCGNFRKSTMLKYLNSGDYDAAGYEFRRWTRAGEAHPPGLVTRRAAEQKLFESA